MPYERTISEVGSAITTTFDQVDAWFDCGDALWRNRPDDDSWTIGEILEHIVLANHFLLLTANKWTKIAVKRAASGQATTGDESDLRIVDRIGKRGIFAWPHPEHMTPQGEKSAIELRSQLHEQVATCRHLLDQLSNGEGELCRIRMSVDNLGKIDLYQWLYFIAQHARRHLSQLEEVKSCYRG